MELVGSEKKIQALFSELKLADQRVTPEFTRMWHRAQTMRSGRAREFRLSFALATAMLLISLAALILWPRNVERTAATIPAVASVSVKQDAISASPPTLPRSTRLVVTQPIGHIRSRRWYRTALTRDTFDLNAGTAAMREVLASSSWQSPTATLLQSPAGYVLTSLPELDRSFNDLKTFLPAMQQ